MKNLDNHVRKIDYILSHPDLRMIIWEATRNCNYHCLHCCIPRGDWDQGKELNTEQVKKIYSEIAQDFGPSKIHVALTGGEATLRSDLMEVIKFLVGLKFKGVSIDSNGFNYAKDLTLIDRLYEAGMRGPTIGVDGLREGYKKTRGMDFFDEIIKVLRYIVARYPDMNLTTFTVINNHNKSEIQELFELLAEIGIKYARVATVIPIGRAAQLPKEAYQLSVDEFHELLEWVGRKRQEYREKKFPMEIELSEDGWCGLKYETITKRDNYMFFCQTGLKVAGLLYDGKIAACPHLGRNLTVQGDALTQRFSDVWKNEFKMFRTSRDWLKTGKCQDCSVWEYCRGGPLHYRDEKATMFKCLYWEDIVPVLKKFGDDDAQYISRNAQKIGIVGAENEAHTYHMKRVLESYHAQVTIIDTLNFPKNITFSLLDDNPKYQGESIDNLAAFYVRMKFYSHPPYDLEEQRAAGKLDLKSWYADYMAERERQSLLTSWLRCAALRGKRIINPVESFDLHYLKSYQLALLRKYSIPVPHTLVTNNAEELKAFSKEIGSIVYKPVAGGASCKLMTEGDWKEERLALLQNAPVLFQEYVDGDNIRVYVLDGRIISTGIIHTKEIDYRGNEESIEKVKLPEAVNQMCVRAMKICGLRFTGIDLKRRSNGEYVLIECNPSPMFLGFQKATGDPIDAWLAEAILRKS